jgi:hypothetical protein
MGGCARACDVGKDWCLLYHCGPGGCSTTRFWAGLISGSWNRIFCSGGGCVLAVGCTTVSSQPSLLLWRMHSASNRPIVSSDWWGRCYHYPCCASLSRCRSNKIESDSVTRTHKQQTTTEQTSGIPVPCCKSEHHGSSSCFCCSSNILLAQLLSCHTCDQSSRSM